MNWNSPGYESTVSSAIDQRIPIDYEELFTERKSIKDNHNPRPGTKWTYKGDLSREDVEKKMHTMKQYFDEDAWEAVNSLCYHK
ncbi:hypothetical protein OUZ56_021819 [Daphnia magna]|uniref:Uncharacterized protein n=1 Tax=Daphnia magna TaxID=35525 RepID=A0ABR0AUJ6_9CRUS|nr:hypothetical protein OUZ56_021819 [Daphnia magna]